MPTGSSSSSHDQGDGGPDDKAAAEMTHAAESNRSPSSGAAGGRRRDVHAPRPEPTPAQIDRRIECAFRDVLKLAVAWRMTTDRADTAAIGHAASALHAAVVEYESAIAAWSEAAPIGLDG